MTTFYSGTLIVCVFEMMKVWMAIATSYFENKQVKSSSLLSYLNQNHQKLGVPQFAALVK
jgi:hypothetical protein